MYVSETLNMILTPSKRRIDSKFAILIKNRMTNHYFKQLDPLFLPE